MGADCTVDRVVLGILGGDRDDRRFLWQHHSLYADLGNGAALLGQTNRSVGAWKN